MTKSRNSAEDSKRYIAEKAREIFSQKGYFLASMEEIRQNTGMSKGNIYYHFKSKEALFIYILELYMEDWMNKWNELSSPLKTAKEKLYKLAEHFALDYENPLMKAAAEFNGSESADAEVREALIKMTGMYFPILKEIIDEGVKNIEFKQMDTNNLTYILFGLLAGLGSICYTMNKSEVVSLSKTAIDITLNGIAN